MLVKKCIVLWEKLKRFVKIPEVTKEKLIEMGKKF